MKLKKIIIFGFASFIAAQLCLVEVFGRLPRSWLASLGQENAKVSETISGGNRRVGEPFARTNLFFGRAKPDGSKVTDEEFRRFLDEVITPRFPDGLTALSGTGQFRGASGTVTREDSVLLILLYPADDTDNSLRIEEIRKAYRQTFRQESVLRVDTQTSVSF